MLERDALRISSSPLSAEGHRDGAIDLLDPHLYTLG